MRELRTAMPRVVARTASAIQAEVPAYSGPMRGARRALIETAVGAGLRELADHASGKARADVAVIQMFRNLGWSEGVAGETLEAMRAAFDVATREAWTELHRVAREQGLTMSVLGRLGDALFEHADQLRDEVEAGHQAGRDEAGAGAILAREQLTRQLLADEDPDALGWLAVKAGWPLPERTVVICAELSERSNEVEQSMASAGGLVLVAGMHVLIACDVGNLEQALASARRVLGETLIAVSPPVPARRLADAVRLVRRAFRLTELGVIPRADVVDCSDHEVALWVHAEPLLRERVLERLLAPLTVQSPHRRYVLALTMILWLEQRASASALGAQLGVHPQTVRYRLRQLNRMLEPDLNDPRSALPMLLALKSVLPEWAPS